MHGLAKADLVSKKIVAKNHLAGIAPLQHPAFFSIKVKQLIGDVPLFPFRDAHGHAKCHVVVELQLASLDDTGDCNLDTAKAFNGICIVFSQGIDYASSWRPCT